MFRKLGEDLNLNFSSSSSDYPGCYFHSDSEVGMWTYFNLSINVALLLTLSLSLTLSPSLSVSVFLSLCQFLSLQFQHALLPRMTLAALTALAAASIIRNSMSTRMI